MLFCEFRDKTKMINNELFQIYSINNIKIIKKNVKPIQFKKKINQSFPESIISRIIKFRNKYISK